MARLPQPPVPHALRQMTRYDDVLALDRRTRLVRIFTRGGRHGQQWNGFRYTGPLPHARFDPQQPGPGGVPAMTADEGVSYFGLDLANSVASVFQVTSIVDPVTRAPYLTVFRPARSIQVLDLSRNWPTRAGASQEISSGPKAITQAWARAIRAAFPELDGVYYRSSMDAGNPTICLWDPPAASAIPLEPDILLPLNHKLLSETLRKVCEELDYTLLG
jgi:hypothetical protein